jgi:hypothetical protein
MQEIFLKKIVGVWWLKRRLKAEERKGLKGRKEGMDGMDGRNGRIKIMSKIKIRSGRKGGMGWWTGGMPLNWELVIENLSFVIGEDSSGRRVGDRDRRVACVTQTRGGFAKFGFRAILYHA